MKSIKTLMMVFLGAVLVVPVLVNAAEFKGQVVGHSCAHDAKICPLNGLEEHLATEPDFVLVDEDGTYVYLHNLPRSSKYRHALKDAIVTGKLDKKSGGIMVETFTVDGEVVWSVEDQLKSGRPCLGCLGHAHNH